MHAGLAGGYTRKIAAKRDSAVTVTVNELAYCPTLDFTTFQFYFSLQSFTNLYSISNANRMVVICVNYESLHSNIMVGNLGDSSVR